MERRTPINSKGKAGEDIVFRVQASELGSKLTSMLVLSDTDGQMLASAGQDTNTRDAELNFKLPRAGQYMVSISDRDQWRGRKTIFIDSMRAICPT